jgi:hypothetical protein
MKKNMGKVDRILRAVVGIVLLAFIWTGQISGTLGVVLTVVAVVLLVTSILGFCPLYVPVKISTQKK